MGKIKKQHLERAAAIYVRQSSLSQVEQNLESQRRQYALVDRARDLGWHDIRVVDEDLVQGVSSELVSARYPVYQGKYREISRIGPISAHTTPCKLLN